MVVDELEVCNATTTAATAAAATATVVAAAAAPAAAPEAAADVPAAPALLEAPADAEDCANDGTASDITNTSVDIIFKIRIKLTPTFS